MEKKIHTIRFKLSASHYQKMLVALNKYNEAVNIDKEMLPLSQTDFITKAILEYASAVIRLKQLKQTPIFYPEKS